MDHGWAIGMFMKKIIHWSIPMALTPFKKINMNVDLIKTYNARFAIHTRNQTDFLV